MINQSPAPWRTAESSDGFGTFVADRIGTVVTKVFSTDPLRERDNAILIAAAPAMECVLRTIIDEGLLDQREPGTAAARAQAVRVLEAIGSPGRVIE